MTKDEMRLTRREWINLCLQTNYRLGIKTVLTLVKGFVRQQEKQNSGRELKAYGSFNG